MKFDEVARAAAATARRDESTALRILDQKGQSSIEDLRQVTVVVARDQGGCVVVPETGLRRGGTRKIGKNQREEARPHGHSVARSSPKGKYSSNSFAHVPKTGAGGDRDE